MDISPGKEQQIYDLILTLPLLETNHKNISKLTDITEYTVRAYTRRLVEMEALVRVISYAPNGSPIFVYKENTKGPAKASKFKKKRKMEEVIRPEGI